jgi:hypothetical protein
LLSVYFIFQFTAFPEFSFLVFDYRPLNVFFKGNLLNLVFIFYFFFASGFLDASKRYPRLDRFIMTVVRINLGIWCVGSALLFILPNSPVLPVFNKVEFLLILVLAILGTLAVTRFWSYLERFFVAGVSALILSALYNVYVHLFHIQWDTSPVFIDPAVMLILCVLIEQFTYAYAIVYKARMEKNKVAVLEKYWINELQTNKQLQNELQASMTKYQEQLESQIKERLAEIYRRDDELQEEKLQKRLEEYKRSALESELKALRTQINPHFLFNCMNILSSFVIRDLKEEALDFILKFSRLMRLVLENSSHHQVRIEKDIEALKLYVHLEAVRYDHTFKYKFDIDPELLSDDYHIPPLLLQPYVENAIHHGLGNKASGERRLNISLKLRHDNIVCEIFDNGVGREKANALKTSHPLNMHRSMGMKVTESRITLLRELSKGKASVYVIDLVGDNTGTVIRIILPVN